MLGKHSIIELPPASSYLELPELKQLISPAGREELTPTCAFWHLSDSQCWRGRGQVDLLCMSKGQLLDKYLQGRREAPT
jgi:hypothetical protein